VPITATEAPQNPEPAGPPPTDTAAAAPNVAAVQTADDAATPETPETIDDFIRTTVDAALGRLDMVLGVDPSRAHELDDSAAPDDSPDSDNPDDPDDDFDARAHLVAASTRAVSRYFAERGLETGGDSPLRITPSLLAEHGLPLATVVLAAIESMMTTVLRDTYEGRKPKPAGKPADLALDFSDLFDPTAPDDQGGER